MLLAGDEIAFVVEQELLRHTERAAEDFRRLTIRDLARIHGVKDEIRWDDRADGPAPMITIKEGPADGE
jgi:hypothetical protein